MTRDNLDDVFYANTTRFVALNEVTNNVLRNLARDWRAHVLPLRMKTDGRTFEFAPILGQLLSQQLEHISWHFEGRINLPLFMDTAFENLVSKLEVRSGYLCHQTALQPCAQPIVEAFQKGVEIGIFRSDLDGYLVRNLVLGFIEHLTTQWVVVGRPKHISEYRDTIHEMVMRAIERSRAEPPLRVRVDIEGGKAEIVRTDDEE